MMVDVNYISEIAFNIIANSGMAKSLYIEALQKAKLGLYDQAKEKINEGEEFFILGHSCHRDLIVLETRTLEPQVTLLMVHAEDQLMAAETTKLLIEEMIQLYQK